ncbi:MBL fold metallo-hydrolase [Saccharothrix sp. AJ9571]|nr:MBL fold metallo-hydrolase [Saccharothrix sp. AJ9571]
MTPRLDVRWHPGHPVPKFDTAPPLQVHTYDERTWILRQNKALNYEAPFLFLLSGQRRALLLDTGATAEAEFFPLRATVDELIGDRELVVAHTHGHGDHVAADGQFADRPRTTIVGRSRDEVIAYFGFTDWPNERREFDLGGRALDLIPGPGHESAAIVIHDREPPTSRTSHRCSSPRDTCTTCEPH